jgi:hypothetical protein
MPNIQNIQLNKVLNNVVQDQIFQPDGVTPQDVTGWSLECVFHQVGNESNVLLTKTTANGGIVFVTPTSGLIQILVNPSDMTGWLISPNGTLGYFVQRTDTGLAARPTAGLVTVYGPP